MNYCIVNGSATFSRKCEVPKIKSNEKKWPHRIKLLMGSILQPTSYLEKPLFSRDIRFGY